MTSITSLSGESSSSNYNGITHYETFKYSWLNSSEEECTFKAWSHSADQPGFFRIFTIISVLTVLVVLVVLGNALVIAAVILRRRLRSATGLLILSLAVADLLVGLVILPFSIANEVLNSYWIFGDTWCTMWLTMDIWMCTASIYNLVAISIDRYIAIIKPLNYPMLVTKFRARIIVAAVWIGSFIICSPSFILGSLGGNEEQSTQEPEQKCTCTPANSGVVYIIISASSSFYLPMIVVIFVYIRIYIAACAATKSVYSGMMEVTATANKNPKNALMQNPAALSRVENMPMLRVHRGSSASTAFKSAPNSQQDLKLSRISPSNTNMGESVYEKMVNNISIENDKNVVKYKRDSQEDNHHPNPNDYHHHENYAEILQMGPIHEQREDSTESNDPIEPLNGPNQKKTMESNGCVKNVHTINNTSETNRESNGNCIRFNQNTNENNNIAQKNLLHPNNAKQKKSIGATVLTRLIKRGPRKKAGSSYEKRLSLEIKAAKTVAIVTGCFIFCWLGFSILYGFSIKTHPVVWSIFFWLGYLNSALNPVIYTVFNREFRTCFKRLLTCNNWMLNHQSSTHYNSYNSNMRSGRPGYSTVSAQPVLTSRSSPPQTS